MRFQIIFPVTVIMFATILLTSKSFCQTKDTLKEISLPAIVIKAFEQNRKLKDVPAAVNYIGRQMLDNFPASSIVSAINTTPGVRIEERSPGSYRLNIRGSSLRSPFGVRNVKIYYNDIPFTDPGGDSYLNQLGNYDINSIEIIKGSNNSVYGAGTGGVMLIESINEKDQGQILGGYTIGSYHLQNYNASLTSASDKYVVRYGFQYQKSNGYREHSKIEKTTAGWNGLFKLGKKNLLKTTFLFGDLFYETPGALTKAELMASPKAARPGNPGAVTANAYIKQKTFLSGASYEQTITSKLQNKTTLYGMFTELINPNLRNYEKSSRPHFGTRTVFKFQQSFKNAVLDINGGGEFQQGFTSVNIHKNINGSSDSLRSHDEINNRQSMMFLQTSLDFKDWILITGASWNTLKVRFQRFIPASSGKQNRVFNNQIAPRFSVMKKFKELNIYTSIAKGFSPPTTNELLPTGGAINLGLNAEEGTNYDLGLKGTFFNSLYVDINLFTFSLSNTIVQRRDAAGGDFFVNAGKTKQHGMETLISYPLLLPTADFKKSLFWLSHTWHNFHYKEFKQLTNDFSGKRLPSVPQHTVSSGVDILMNNGFSAGINYFYSDKIQLNDANSEHAESYHLVGAKLGFEKLFKNRTGLKISGGADNLLNAHYSLGNDINAFGGRYYNAAPLRNFYASVTFMFAK
ncbi:MAG: TonB-dependent receptor plug domain-containing protein [Ginsengibacter sp.]